ncbi:MULTISPECIES: NAD(+) synthase [unclassified Oceanispirochaeta]|uniref:NAD(+) synthase n=1 Tax=unclassified Oceanispirochaeta TaxID=2635722 RepID=UPI000E0914F5|nr:MULTISPECIES: NAD(+) synthase [unclassified Oceanispirochaeta]MBF9015419.1 NAD(+) synthase [Oceanispirochaeta sp. M2]NPD71878.1 NAD(+) synthase [Oceanispirochaeta sp. M1]RDG32687.1 NAD(+) synthase [Oceanispirochaeta sp. M1]
MKQYGFVRICAAVPTVKPAAVEKNIGWIIDLINNVKSEEPDLLLLPELSLTGYSCSDLFRQNTLLQKSREALMTLAEETINLDFPVIVGIPLVINSALYNCAAVLSRGQVLGIVPKTYIPNSNEFYERRWFSSGRNCLETSIDIMGGNIPFGTDLIFQDEKYPLMRFAIEICEDLWSPLPPSTTLSLGGALIIANPSASNELVGKAEYRKQVTSQQSARCIGTYVYASAGPGESTTDTVYGGHSLIYENGRLLKEGERFQTESSWICCDTDLEFLEHQRLSSPSWSQSKDFEAIPCRTICYEGRESESKAKSDFLRYIDPHPFVPSSSDDRTVRCREIFSIQSTALAARLRHIGCKTAVLGLSGGLDSTLALLVAQEAFKRADLPLEGLQCYTMPGFGTTKRTKGNAELLCEELNIPLEVIDIQNISTIQLQELDHSGEPSDVAYENVQARQRTMYLMNKANMLKGIVIGTGDLSELALGWCTYNGDHMSMYAVNTGVPKTLVRYLVQFVADQQQNRKAAEILYDVIDTPISPELLPPDKQGEIAQKTEDVIGPYELHDFFLYQIVRCGFGPAKTFRLAEEAFSENYDRETIRKWLHHFIWRFFTQQFKRSCLPDGPKVGTIALSPRGDWRMPSDSDPEIWLKELDSAK